MLRCIHTYPIFGLLNAMKLKFNYNLRTSTHIIVGSTRAPTASHYNTLLQHMRFDAYIYIMFSVDVVQVYCVY